MRFLLLLTSILLCGCDISPPRGIEESSRLGAVYAITLERELATLSSEGGGGEPKACMHTADPNFPCPCQNNLAACPHTPKCVDSSAGARIRELETQKALLEETHSKAIADVKSREEGMASKIKTLEVELAKTKTEADSLRAVQSVDFAKSIEAVKSIIPTPSDDAVGFSAWKSTLPETCIVYVGRSACPPCRSQESVVLAGLVRSHWPTVYVDADKGPVAEWLKVGSTPTMIGFKDAKEVGRLSGVMEPLDSAIPFIIGWFKK